VTKLRAHQSGIVIIANHAEAHSHRSIRQIAWRVVRESGPKRRWTAGFLVQSDTITESWSASNDAYVKLIMTPLYRYSSSYSDIARTRNFIFHRGSTILLIIRKATNWSRVIIAGSRARSIDTRAHDHRDHEAIGEQRIEQKRERIRLSRWTIGRLSIRPWVTSRDNPAIAVERLAWNDGNSGDLRTLIEKCTSKRSERTDRSGSQAGFCDAYCAHTARVATTII